MSEVEVVEIVRNKEKYYVGEDQFFNKNKQLREGYASIKQLEKVVLSQPYLAAKPNLYFILLFNILADTQFYADRYSKYLQF